MTKGFDLVMTPKGKAHILGETLPLGEFNNETRIKYMAYLERANYKRLFEESRELQKEADALRTKMQGASFALHVERIKKQISARSEALDKRIAELTHETWTDEVDAQLQKEAEAIDKLSQDMTLESLQTKQDDILTRLNKLGDDKLDRDLKFIAELLSENEDGSLDKEKYDELLAKATPEDKIKASEIITLGNASPTPTELSLPLNRSQRRGRKTLN
jgi:hypothetical protein